VQARELLLLAAARGRPTGDLKRQADLHDQSPPRDQVQRRDASDGSLGQAVARPAPDLQGLHACERDLADRLDRRERQLGRVAPEATVLAADSTARRSRRDDHVAEGDRRPRGHVRDESRLRRRVHVQGAGRRRPHHAREVAALLRHGEGSRCDARLPDHDRPELAHPEPAGRGHPGRRPRPVDRRPGAAEEHDRHGDQDSDHRLPGSDIEHRQQKRPAEAVLERGDAARPLAVLAASVRPGARPDGDQQGGLQRAEPARLLPDLAGQPLVRDDQRAAMQPARESGAGGESSSRPPESRRRSPSA
jgi:hypothetical protein